MPRDLKPLTVKHARARVSMQVRDLKFKKKTKKRRYLVTLMTSSKSLVRGCQGLQPDISVAINKPAGSQTVKNTVFLWFYLIQESTRRFTAIIISVKG